MHVGSQPKSGAATAVHAKHEEGADARLVLIVDQLEEIFTLAMMRDRRYLFIHALHGMSTSGVSDTSAPVLVMLGCERTLRPVFGLSRTG